MWYYADNGQQQGPLPLAELQVLFQQGRLTADTLLWHEGMAEWTAASSVPDLQSALAQAKAEGNAEQSDAANTAAPATGSCSHCGQSFAAAELLDIQGQRLCGACQGLLAQRLRSDLQLLDGSHAYAGFWIRGAAWFLDSALLNLLSFVLILLPLGSYLMSRICMFNHFDGCVIPSYGFRLQWHGLLYFLQVALPLLYHGFFLSRYGATPGKMLLGLQVQRVDGRRLSFVRGACRGLASALSTLLLFLGYLMAAFDAQKRALHDHICDSRVVYGRR
jgi:uncharacterized RDD family membrane protein YckC